MGDPARNSSIFENWMFKSVIYVKEANAYVCIFVYTLSLFPSLSSYDGIGVLFLANWTRDCERRETIKEPATDLGTGSRIGLILHWPKLCLSSHVRGSVYSLMVKTPSIFIFSGNKAPSILTKSRHCPAIQGRASIKSNIV